MEVLTHGGEHHEIGDGGWLMMTTVTDSPLRSPERTPDQPSRERAWRRLRIVKRDESFSLIFFLPESEHMELKLRSVERQGAHEAGARPRGQAQPPPSWTGCGPLALILSPVFFTYSKNILC